MAARRSDERLQAVLDSRDVAQVVEALSSSSPARTERLWLGVSAWPVDPAVGAAAAAWLVDFPVRQREDLGAAAAAVGAFVLHRGSASGFEHLRAIDRPTAVINTWRSALTRALARFLRRASAPPGRSTATTLPPGPRGAVHQAWMALAASRDPKHTVTLCARLSDGPATDVVERFIALVDFPRSAEVADAAAQLVDKPLVKVNVASPLFPLLGLVLLAHGDDAHRPALRALGAQLPSLAWLELALPHGVPKAARRPASVRAASSTDDDFLAAIAASADDLDLRRAWMDSLLERGEPRGDFMALQLADRPLTRKEQQRLGALKKKHERAWLRTLWPAIIKDSVRFERGVLTAVGFSLWGPAGRAPSPDDPQLATVEDVTLTGGPSREGEALVRSERFGRLRRLRVSAALLPAVPARRVEGLERLAIDVQWNPEPFTLRSASAVLDRWALGHLEALELQGVLQAEEAAVAATSKWLPSLRHLVVESTSPERWFSAVRTTALERLVVEWPQHLGSATWTFTRADPWALDVEVGSAADEARALKALGAFDAPLRHTRPKRRPA